MFPTCRHSRFQHALPFAIALLAVSFLAGHAIAAEARYALLIGNGAYQSANDLRNPANDVSDLEKTLQQLGFEVTSVTDADHRTMNESIDRFVESLSPGSVGLFHFSGHGLQVDQENYLIPVDFELQDEASVPYDAVSASKIHDRMARSGSRLNMVVLDACRNNGFATARSGSAGLAAMHAARGSFIAFATAPGSTASDNPGGRNGLFTSHLLSALRKPGLKLDEVFNDVRKNVYEASGGKQLAWSSSSVIGDFYFLPAGASSPDRRDLELVAQAQDPPAPPNDRRQQSAPATNSSAPSNEALEDRLIKLLSRGAAVRASLDNLRSEQARQGVSLRGDMAAAATRLDVLLNQAETALDSGNHRRAERSMDQVEPVLETLEKFLGM